MRHGRSVTHFDQIRAVAWRRQQRVLAAGEITVYKSATCGCCKLWVKHLEANGFTVKAHDVSNLTAYKKANGVPAALSSCHTATIGGYAIEGHVPASDIHRLLRERPGIRGLAVPGMPIGSPGMEEGKRRERFDVLSFDRLGQTAVFSHYPSIRP